MRTKPIPMPKAGAAMGEFALISHGLITAVKKLSRITHVVIPIPKPKPHQAIRVAGRSLKRFRGVFKY
jgi:hypothetical protein